MKRDRSREIARKAIAQDKYGAPDDVLKLKEIDKPVVKDDKELVESGKVTPVIARTYPLSETPEALAYVEKGHTRGKVVITGEITISA